MRPIEDAREKYWLPKAKLTRNANVGRHSHDPNQSVHFQKRQFDTVLGRLRGKSGFSQRRLFDEAEEKMFDFIKNHEDAQEVMRRVLAAGPIEHHIWIRPADYDEPYHSVETNTDPIYWEQKLETAFDMDFRADVAAASAQFAGWLAEAKYLRSDLDFRHWYGLLIARYCNTRAQDDGDGLLDFKGALPGRTQMPKFRIVKMRSSDAMRNGAQYYAREMRATHADWGNDCDDLPETDHVFSTGKIRTGNNLEETRRLVAYYKNRFGDDPDHEAAYKLLEASGFESGSAGLIDDQEFTVSALNYSYEMGFNSIERLAEVKQMKAATLRQQICRERERISTKFDFKRVSDKELCKMVMEGGYYAQVVRKNQLPEIICIHPYRDETETERERSITAAIYSLLDTLREKRIQRALTRVGKTAALEKRIEVSIAALNEAKQYVSDNMLRETRVKFFDAGAPGALVERLRGITTEQVVVEPNTVDARD